MDGKNVPLLVREAQQTVRGDRLSDPFPRQPARAGGRMNRSEMLEGVRASSRRCSGDRRPRAPR